MYGFQAFVEKYHAGMGSSLRGAPGVPYHAMVDHFA